MQGKVEKLWIRTLWEDKKAFRKLGKYYLIKGKKKAAQKCLQKAMELGDEKSFFLYYFYFPMDEQSMDIRSYMDMQKEYKETKDKRKRRQLKKYLSLWENAVRREHGSAKGISKAPLDERKRKSGGRQKTKGYQRNEGERL